MISRRNKLYTSPMQKMRWAVKHRRFKLLNLTEVPIPKGMIRRKKMKVEWKIALWVLVLVLVASYLLIFGLD